MNEEIEKFIRSCVFASDVLENYYGLDNEKYFFIDKRVHDTARSQCHNYLKRLGAISDEEFIKASKEAWSGRIQYTGGGITYCAGQFGKLEAPQAMSAVLATIETNRQ